MGSLVERVSRRAARSVVPEGFGIAAFVVGMGAAAVGFCMLMCTLS